MRHLLIAFALCSLALPAAAQPAPWQPVRATAGWVFTPGITFGAMWDSNVTVAGQGNPTTSELVGIVNPRGEIDFNSRRARFSAGYSGSLETYRELDELTRYDQRGRVDAQYLLTPRLQVTSRQVVTLSPTTDQLELPGVRFTRVGSRMVDSLGGFAYDLNTRSKLTVNYNFQWVSFDRSPEFPGLRGGHSHSPSAELRFQLGKRLDVGATWAYRHTSIDGDDEIFDAQDVRGVIEYEVGPYTAIRGNAGLARVSVDQTGETKTGPSFGGGISHKTSLMSLGASYERTLLPSFGFGNLSANQSFHAGVSVPLAGGRMQASTGYTWRRNEPALATSLTIPMNSHWWTSSFGFQAARWLRTEAFLSMTHQTSEAQGLTDRSRVGIQFVTHKPMRIQ
jgi:hypothetical protein